VSYWPFSYAVSIAPRSNTMAGEHYIDCKLGSMDFFSPRLFQSSIKDSQVVAYNPSASIEQNAPVKFIIPGITQSYIALNPKLACRWKVTNENGGNLAADTNVGTLNYLHGTAWNSIDVTLNQVSLTQPNNLAHIVAYLQAKLSYTQDVKQRSLQRELWYEDTAGAFTHATNNAGFVSRKAVIAGSREFETIGRICHPLFNTGAVLPNGVEIVITLHRSPDSYVILDLNDAPAAPAARINYKLQLLDAVLYVTRLLPSDSQFIQDTAELDKKAARIFFPKIDVKSLTVPAQVSAKSFHSLYTGLLPKRIVCCLLPNVTTAYTTNGLELQHFNISCISVIVGSRRYPAKDLNLDFTNRRYMRAYDQLFDALNLSGNAADIGISYSDYGNGNTIFAWDLTASQCSSSSDHYDHPAEGDLSLEITFSVVNDATISVIMCSEFVQMLEIDKYRNIQIKDE
jgi:hypothetical protein